MNLKKQQLRMNRPEIFLGMECKKKVIEIFGLINELELDIRLRYMMNFFKGLYEATELFEVYDKEPDYDIVKPEEVDED